MKIKFKTTIPLIIFLFALIGCEGKQSNRDFILVSGGMVDIGSKNGLPTELPIKKYSLESFYLAAHPVTVRQFREFIQATDYVTEAEFYGDAGVFSFGQKRWLLKKGAYWEYPSGLDQQKAKNDHPVTQVSWNDAIAYTQWKGERLPTEVEWEHAARAGQGDVLFPWGNTEPDDDFFMPCNIWQGQFPYTNTAKDGFLTTAPVRSFSPNSWGIHNMVGNVWEWTNDAFKLGHLDNSDKENIPSFESYKIFKGGSFVCHRSYCYRYRIAARSGASPESSSSHYGFRVVWSS